MLAYASMMCIVLPARTEQYYIVHIYNCSFFYCTFTRDARVLYLRGHATLTSHCESMANLLRIACSLSVRLVSRWHVSLWRYSMLIKRYADITLSCSGR